MHSITFFNNKGGVGKTTLACNIASVLARQHDERILLVDCDPQCNSTQLILDEADWYDLYATKKGAGTLFEVLSPIERGDASINTNVIPMSGSSNRFGVSILPGHPKMSVLEDELGKAWVEVQAARLGGFRRTNWLHALLAHYDADYDIAILDVGPSLGSLNRSILLATDYFVTPMGPDIFSIIGIQNMAEWLGSWIAAYELAVSHYLTANKTFEEFPIVQQPGAASGFLGYTVLQYITKSKSGQRRPTVAFEKIISEVPSEVLTRLGKFLARQIKPENLRLGDVPNMFSIVALAQAAHAPIGDLEHADGLVGAQAQQQQKYADMLHDVCEQLLENLL